VLLLSVTCKREDKQTPKELDVDNEQEVTIELASGEVTLTLVQAEKLAVELQTLVDKQGATLVPPLQGPVGDPEIRGDGQLRIGAWLAQGRMDNLALVQRVPGAGFQHYAIVGRIQGEWTIVSLHAEHLRPR
jgi:hypothetical protein